MIHKATICVCAGIFSLGVMVYAGDREHEAQISWGHYTVLWANYLESHPEYSNHVDQTWEEMVANSKGAKLRVDTMIAAGLGLNPNAASCAAFVVVLELEPDNEKFAACYIKMIERIGQWNGFKQNPKIPWSAEFVVPPHWRHSKRTMRLDELVRFALTRRIASGR